MAIAELGLSQQIITPNLNQDLYVYENGNGYHEDDHEPLQVVKGWSSYEQLGIYTDKIYKSEGRLCRPVGMGPVTPITIENSGATIISPRHDAYKYTLDVAFLKASAIPGLDEDDLEGIVSASDMEIPTLGFQDFHGEDRFKKMPFSPGELWRMARFGLANEDPRLAVPHIQFDPGAVTLLAQTHFLTRNGVQHHKPEPQNNTYAPMTGYGEAYMLKVRNTDVTAKVMVKAKFQGIR
jgi:hypothetical protein